MDEVVLDLMEVRNNSQLFHWQTPQYQSHLAANAFLLAIDPLIDQLLEVMQGARGQHVPPLDAAVPLRTRSDEEMGQYIATFANHMGQHAKASRHESVANIFAELEAAAQQFAYLLTFQ